ncbi:D-beta-hydroxybutyrate dehydrogenase-like 5 [Homarus americanus]|uniref:D-beta-hydroxybutyrate dehydrogenase-like 5 n=1 Tax=Homarus americanus TaxID=6706 RepID=A0A8J5JMT8_HOMAM|nr:D-beta-hydroxybutyrate dehydrogenase-like 5 [Homarus americanus]
MFLTYDKISRVLFWGCVSALLATLLNLLGLCSCCVTFPLAWLLSSLIYLALASMKVPMSRKAVLITGCDTGFGHALALHLDKMGVRVFACVLKSGGEGAERLRKGGSSRLHVLQMDITNQEEVKKALEDVKNLLPAEEVLWGLVNNAAICTHGAVEWVTMETCRKISDVNIFGTIAVTKTFLPLIRKAKGRIVSMGSARGRLHIPIGTTYDLNKHALEGFNDGLSKKKCLFRTGIFRESDVRRDGKAMWAAMDEEVKTAYGKDFFDETINFQLNITRSGNPDVSEVLTAMTDALTQKYPQSRYQPMDITIYLAVFLNQHFPEWVYDYLWVEYILKKGL